MPVLEPMSKPSVLWPPLATSLAESSIEPSMEKTCTGELRIEIPWMRELGRGLGVEHLGLGLAAVGAESVPPLCAAAVEDGAGGARFCDIGAGDGDQWAGPLCIAEGGCALKDDLSAVVEAGKVEGLACGDCNV